MWESGTLRKEKLDPSSFNNPIQQSNLSTLSDPILQSQCLLTNQPVGVCNCGCGCHALLVIFSCVHLTLFCLFWRLELVLLTFLQTQHEDNRFGVWTQNGNSCVCVKFIYSWQTTASCYLTFSLEFFFLRKVLLNTYLKNPVIFFYVLLIKKKILKTVLKLTK